MIETREFHDINDDAIDFSARSHDAISICLFRQTFRQ